MTKTATDTDVPLTPAQLQVIAPHPWTATHYSYEAAETLPPHLRPGGNVRLAVLLHLAQQPQGVSQSTLGLIALGACNRKQVPPSVWDMRVICGHLCAQGLLAAEQTSPDNVRYFSPPARKVARLRAAHGYTLPARIQPAQVTE
jgi:hypothetical protein